MSESPHHYLFAGVCGMGMAPLALYLRSRGDRVSGVDDYADAHVRSILESGGVEFFDSVHPIQSPDTVVMSRALQHEGTRVDALKALFPDARFCFRGECLADVVREKKLLAVVGSHGKTTTTAMTIHRLLGESLCADYILGGLFKESAYPPSRWSSDSEWVVAEIDESDGTIEAFSPEVTVITNLDWDHMDCYQSEEEMLDSFRRLIARTRGKVITRTDSRERLGLENETSMSDWIVLPALGSGPQLGFNPGNWELSGIAVSMMGGATPVCEEGAGALLQMASFPGVERRQGVYRLDGSNWMVQDYAHHPTELKALFDWAGTRFPEHRIVWVFQPHRYSRTRHLMDGFARVLSSAESILLPEYAAFEHFDASGTSEGLLARVSSLGIRPTHRMESPHALLEWMRSQESAPTVYLFAGAGDIDKWAKWVLSAWGEGSFEDKWVKYITDLVMPQTRLAVNEPLKHKMSLNVGGCARLYAEPASAGDLQIIMKTANLLGIRTVVMGRGSNLMADDAGFDGLVIRLSQSGWRGMADLGQGRIWARAGLPLKELARKAASLGVSGFEFLEGIPGSVGGALRMNAGAMGREMRDVLEQVELLSPDGRVERLPAAGLAMGYRCSPGLDRYVILGAVLAGQHGHDPEAIRQTMEAYSKRRKSTQPWEPSAGCIFRNPPSMSAGKLIDEAGLKGLRIGGAMVSPIHGNFLVNTGEATSTDVEALIRAVRERVNQVHHIELELELRRLGHEHGPNHQDTMSGSGVGSL